jgi:hypothetical protein
LRDAFGDWHELFTVTQGSISDQQEAFPAIHRDTWRLSAVSLPSLAGSPASQVLHKLVREALGKPPGSPVNLHRYARMHLETGRRLSPGALLDSSVAFLRLWLS